VVQLARLQAEGGDLPEALATLEQAASEQRRQADFLALNATLLQMSGRHGAAIELYQSALRSAPERGSWLAGLAIALDHEQRRAEADLVYRRALAAGDLTGEVQGFVQRRLRLAL
jgi:MSHA biogenesis protein MshN